MKGMRNKVKSLTPSIAGDFTDYARSCASISTEQQINLQTMRYKDASPLNLKRLTYWQQQQQQQQQGLQQQQLQLNSPNRGLQFYLNHSKQQQSERNNRHTMGQVQANENNIEQTQSKNQQQDRLKQRLLISIDPKQSGSELSLTNIQSAKRIKEKEMRNTLINYSQIQNESRLLMKSKEKTPLIEQRRMQMKNNSNNIFTEDTLFLMENNEAKQNIKKQEMNQVHTPLQDVFDYQGQDKTILNRRDNDTDKKQLKSIILSTSFTLNSSNRNNIIPISAKSQLLQNNFSSTQQIGLNKIRNAKHAYRSSERLQQQQVEQYKSSRVGQQRNSFQMCDRNKVGCNEEIRLKQLEEQEQEINVKRRASNKQFESNYSLQNKSMILTSTTPSTLPIQSQERAQPNQVKKYTLTQRNSTHDRTNTNFNINAKTDTHSKITFDSSRITSDISTRHMKLPSDLQIKYSCEQEKHKITMHITNNANEQSNPQKEGQLPHSQILTLFNNKSSQEPNQNYFHLNQKNFNSNLKQQLKTASNFNNIHKEQYDAIKKTKMFFSSKQPKAIDEQINAPSSNYFFAAAVSPSAQIPLTPLRDINLNTFNVKQNSQQQKGKSKSPFKMKIVSQINIQEQKEQKKQHKRESSLVEKLEYEYNNMYFNSNQSAQSMLFQNTTTANNNQLIAFNSSPNIPITITPSQSFAAFNNNYPKQFFQHKKNTTNHQHNSQSSISTFTNLNYLEIEDESIANQNFELNKCISLQKTPSINVTTPNLSKNCTINLDQQSYSQLNCKEIINYFGEMKRALEQEILADESFINIIQKKLLINIEQFLYFLSHFWMFCIENFDRFENDFAIFKIEEEHLHKITECMNKTLSQQLNLTREKIIIFINSFNFHSQRLIIPKNLFEHIGGEKQAQKLINDLISHLKYDISIGVQFGKILNEIDPIQAGQMFCSFLKDEVDGIKGAIVFANQELNMTQVEFFLIKQTIYQVLMAEKLIKKKHKMIILEKFEKLRAFVLQDQTQLNLLQDQVFHEAMMIKIRNKKQIISCLRNKERQSIIDFASFTFSMIFGRSTIAEYADKLKNEILIQQQSFITSYVHILEEQESYIEREKEEEKQDRLLKFIQGVEELTLETVNDFMDLSSIYNTEKHMKLKFQFLREHITQEYPNVRNSGRSIVKELRMWAVSNFKKYLKNTEMTEGENSRLDIMDSILKYYFYRQSDVFSFYDVPIAINYFPITRNAVEYWLIGLKIVLSDDSFDLKDQDVEKIIESISSLFSVRWVKKKNQLCFLHPPRI